MEEQSMTAKQLYDQIGELMAKYGECIEIRVMCEVITGVEYVPPCPDPKDPTDICPAFLDIRG